MTFPNAATTTDELKTPLLVVDAVGYDKPTNQETRGKPTRWFTLLYSSLPVAFFLHLAAKYYWFARYYLKDGDDFEFNDSAKRRTDVWIGLINIALILDLCRCNAWVVLVVEAAALVPACACLIFQMKTAWGKYHLDGRKNREPPIENGPFCDREEIIVCQIV